MINDPYFLHAHFICILIESSRHGRLRKAPPKILLKFNNEIEQSRIVRILIKQFHDFLTKIEIDFYQEMLEHSHRSIAG